MSSCASWPSIPCPARRAKACCWNYGTKSRAEKGTLARSASEGFRLLPR
jgi:hypothetical protein